MNKVFLVISVLLSFSVLILTTFVLTQNRNYMVLLKTELQEVKETEMSGFERLQTKIVTECRPEKTEIIIPETDLSFVKEEIDFLNNEISLLETKLTELCNSYNLALETSKEENKILKNNTNTASSELKGKILSCYEKKQYRESYDLCSIMLSLNSEDNWARIVRIKSLYRLNPADSSKYDFIITEIQKVKAMEQLDEECKIIMETIAMEKGEIYE